MTAPKLYPIANDEPARIKDISENYITGYVCLYRSIRNHWIWEDANKLKWWLDILMECNHENKKVNIGYDLYDCKRGQSLHSILEWGKRWRVDKSTARRFLDLLEADRMISTENLLKTTRLTVCNYGSYNDGKHAKQLGRNSDATRTQHEQECKELKEEYKAIQKTKKEIYDFIQKHQPGFIEPYVGIWNCFAEEYKLSKVGKITTSRVRLFSIRMKEDGFNLINILKKASKSDFLLKNNWFSFDWIFENGQNWVRIIEGQYDNNKPSDIKNQGKNGQDYLQQRKKDEEKLAAKLGG